MRNLGALVASAAIVVVIVAGGIGWQLLPGGALAPAAAVTPAPPAAQFPTEQEWLVSDIAAAIEQMASFAEDPGAAMPQQVGAKISAAAPDALVRFDLEIAGGKRATIAITDHIWAPAAYAPLAARLSGTGTACGAVWTAPVVDAMLDPRPAVILSESARISARLQANMHCADAHDEAALLLGAFALREAAGGFSDSRRAMSRMTAHMAVADVLRQGEATVVRRLADAVLLTLAGRQQSAMAAVAALESPSPNADVLAWIRALRLRNTFDWRLMPRDKPATLLEQLSLLRAVEASLGDGQSLDMFDHLERPADVADWARLMVQHSPGVEVGNRFTEPWMAAELAEASEVIQAFDPAAVATPASIVTALNVEPGAGPVDAKGVVHVIDRGAWAAAAQRHLMRAIAARHNHLARMLGLPGDARAFRDNASRAFSGLRMYPFAAVAIAFSRDEVAQTMPGAESLVKTRPDLMTDATRRTLRFMAQYAIVPEPAGAAAWFNPVLPAGTAFDVGSRAQLDGTAPRIDRPGIAKLRTRAPYARRLVMETIRWRGDKRPTYEELRQDYGDLASYDLASARAVADAAADMPELYIQLMEIVCRMDTNGYRDLAPYLADHGRVAEARRAYEEWLRTDHNEIEISKSMGWLVRQYFDEGDQAKATAVADRAAGVGSFGGVVARANLHDWRGELDDAERLYRDSWKRYDDPEELAAFYLRHGRKGPEVDEVVRKVFPAGMTYIASAGPVAKPVDGIVIVVAGQTGYDEGVRPDDVVTAVDGIRVRNTQQYRAARGASTAERMRFSLWRAGKPLEISARLRYRWVVSSTKDYEPGAIALQ